MLTSSYNFFYSTNNENTVFVDTLTKFFWKLKKKWKKCLGMFDFEFIEVMMIWNIKKESWIRMSGILSEFDG